MSLITGTRRILLSPSGTSAGGGGGGGIDPLTLNPIYYYKMVDGNTSTLPDSSGNGYNGTMGLAGIRKPTVTAQGLNFSSMNPGNSGNLVQIPTGGWSSVKTVMYFCDFPVFTGLVNGGFPVLWSVENGSGTFSNDIETDGGLSDFGTGWGGGYGYESSQAVVGPNCIAEVYDAVNNPTLYINGVVSQGYRCNSSSTGSIGNYPQYPSSLFSTPSTIYMGFFIGVGRGYVGNFYTYIAFSQQLTPTQIAGVYNFVKANLAGRGVTLGNTISPTTNQLYWVGDSITAGSGVRYGEERPSVTMNTLNGAYAWKNLGVGGLTSAQILSNIATLTVPLWTGYSGPKNVLILAAGTNDLKLSYTPLSAYNNLLSIGLANCAAGTTHIGIYTVLPSSNISSSDWTTLNNDIAMHYATNIHSSYPNVVVKVFDLRNDMVMGQLTNITNTTYFQNDQTHPAAAGQAYLSMAYEQPWLQFIGFRIGSFIDTFTRANSAPGGVGNGWTDPASAWEILSNQLYTGSSYAGTIGSSPIFQDLGISLGSGKATLISWDIVSNGVISPFLMTQGNGLASGIEGLAFWGASNNGSLNFQWEGGNAPAPGYFGVYNYTPPAGEASSSTYTIKMLLVGDMTVVAIYSSLSDEFPYAVWGFDPRAGSASRSYSPTGDYYTNTQWGIAPFIPPNTATISEYQYQTPAYYLLCDGDSIQDYGPPFTVAMLMGMNYHTVNIGIPSQTLVNSGGNSILGSFSTFQAPLIAAAVTAGQIVIYANEAGTNDAFAGRTAVQIEADIVTLMGLATAAGSTTNVQYTFFGRESPDGTFDLAQWNIIQPLNTYLRANYLSMGINYLVDYGNDARFSDPLAGPPFNPDKTHPTPQGSFWLGQNVYNTFYPTNPLIGYDQLAYNQTLVVRFNLSMNITDATGFTFKDAGSTIAATYVSGTGTSTLVFSLASAVTPGDALTLAYDGTGNVVTAAYSEALPAFTAIAAKNTVPAAISGSPTKGNLTASGTVTLPTVTTGDYLLVIIACNLVGGNLGPTAPAGWTLVTSVTSGSGNSALYLFYKLATGSDTFVSPQAVGVGTYNAYDFSAGTRAVSVDTEITNTGTTSTISSTGTYASGPFRTVLSCFAAYDSSVTAPTIGTPSGSITATAQQTNVTVGLRTGYETLTGGTAGTTTARTAAVTNSTEWTAITVAIL